MKPIITIFEAISAVGIKYLSEFADVRFAYGVNKSQCLKFSSQSDVIIVKSIVKVDKELLANSPKLKIIARAGTGVDNIDINEAKKRNIRVITVPTGNSLSAAEFTILQILSYCRRIDEVIDFMANNDYRRHLLEGRELKSMKIGLVGLGNVGMLVTERLNAFGCKVFGYDPYTKNLKSFKSQGGVYIDSFEEMISEINILSFHARLTSENFHMMDDKQFKKAKSGLCIINCSRANLINQDSLLKYVNSGKVSKVYLDVLEPEPPFDISPKDHQYKHHLLKNTKIHVTPHIAASTIEAQDRISDILSKEIKKNLLII
jgi:D-3-phosphoglycerate dehydrogenase / 2-oxoglutarate reductase